MIGHWFAVEDAIKYGQSCAVILQNIRHWVFENKARGHNCHDGHHWTYNTAAAFAKLFPYMTAAKIARSLRKLEQMGAIISGEYNKNKYDRTKWYTLTEDTSAENSTLDDSKVNTEEPRGLQSIGDESTECTKINARAYKNQRSSPDSLINTDINPTTTTPAQEIKSVAPFEPQPPATPTTRESTLPANWQPSPETIRQLETVGVTADYAKQCMPEFALYWAESGQLKVSWNKTFFTWCKRGWVDLQASPPPITAPAGQKQAQGGGKPSRRTTLAEDLADDSWAY